jgi:hypothetical protein
MVMVAQNGAILCQFNIERPFRSKVAKPDGSKEHTVLYFMHDSDFSDVSNRYESNGVATVSLDSVFAQFLQNEVPLYDALRTNSTLTTTEDKGIVGQTIAKCLYTAGWVNDAVQVNALMVMPGYDHPVKTRFSGVETHMIMVQYNGYTLIRK